MLPKKILPRPLNNNPKLTKNVIGANKNEIPAENINSFPFLPRVKLLRNAVKHPRIIIAIVIARIAERCVKV